MFIKQNINEQKLRGNVTYGERKKEKKEKVVKRPTKKNIIIYFVLAVFFIYAIYGSATYTKNPDHKDNLFINDAIYVGDGKIHPENE